MQLVPRLSSHGYLDTHLWVPKWAINVEGTKQALTFSFSDSRSEHSVRYVYLWKEAPNHLLVPRSFWQISGLPFPVIDCRPREYERSGIVSGIKLDHRMLEDSTGKKQLQPTGRDVQTKSMGALHTHPSGVLVLACGSGKSVVALEFAAQLGVPTIVLVENSQLLEHWSVEISQVLKVPGGVGLVKADVFDWKKPIVLATYQTIAKLAGNAPEEFRRWFGLVIWDEGHHISAPTFALGAEMFYGYRLALTATPIRDDGCHVIYDTHIGPIIYKNLQQDLNARVSFDWTGLAPEETRADCQIRDKTGEMHLSMLGVYFGRWREHLTHVLRRTWEAIQQGRRVLVLCSSVDEAVNLCACWNGMKQLYTDVPIPAPVEVGETLQPIELTQKEKKSLEVEIAKLVKKLQGHKLTPEAQEATQMRLDQQQQLLKQGEVFEKVSALHRKRQKQYLKDLDGHITTGGLMIFKVDPKTRQEYLDTKQVVFCYRKYGREGLNNPALDTVISTMPFSSRNTLQQVKGRAERRYPGKKAPLVLVIEHNIGPIIGMCQKLRNHLKNWPADEGGPFTYEMHNHPHVRGNTCKTPLFG